MTGARHPGLISVEEYLGRELLSDVKNEYAHGHVYRMPGSQNVHGTVAAAFVGTLYGSLRGRPCVALGSNTKVRIRLPTETRFYYPDGMVLCDPSPNNATYQDRPVILGEVISEATRRIDEGEKREAYLTIPTLDTYLLIETDSPRVVVHQRTERGFIGRVYEGIDTTVPLDVIGVHLALTDLYERVNFDTAPSP